MNNQQHHPLEVALAITLALIESVLWLINELAGFHIHQGCCKQPQGHNVCTQGQEPTLNPERVQAIRHQQYADLVETYTVKQLRELLGITGKRVLKAELKAKALCLAC